jgi:hypothetical protein
VARKFLSGVDLDSQKIVNLANGSAAADGAAFGQTPAGGNTTTIAQGGTGQTSASAALNALGGAAVAGDIGGTSAAPAVTSTHLAVVTDSAATGSVNLDPTNTRVFSVTQTGAVTFSFTPGGSLASGTEYSFELWLNPGTYTTTFPASPSPLTWIGGTAPTLVASVVNVLVFTTLNGGSTWYGAAVSEAPGLPLTVSDGGTGTNELAAGAVILGGTTDTSPLTAVSGVGETGQFLASNGTSGAPTWQDAPGATGLSLGASTGADGWTLTDSGSYPAEIISWTAPNDGALHRVLVAGILQVTSADTGAEISADWTLPNGDANSNWSLYVTSEPTGIKQLLSWFYVQANTTFTVNQQAALTGGTATAWIELWTS